MIILASKSPRRKAILDLVNIKYECIPSNVEEVVPDGMPIEEMPEYLSGIKACDVAKGHPEDVIIGSDTLVEFDGKTLGKPADAADAKRMLRELSGRHHLVYTGVTIIYPGGEESFTSITDVEFNELTDEDIDWYVSTGEVYDKAGAYGIQGPGAVLIKGITGDYFTVMGLPIAELVKRLKKIGVKDFGN